jgi:hypothetical protein
MNTRVTVYEDAEVLTKDGESIGRVKEVQGSYFKVDVPHARDFWLSADTVEASDIEGVRLLHEKSHIDGFQLDGPGGEPVDRRGPEVADMDFETTQGEMMRRPGGHFRGTV